jgi:DNA replication and repair protein RecF
LDRSVNILFGENAQGKTNALEGIWLFAGGKSHRTTKEKDLISFGKEQTSLSLLYRDERRENEMTYQISQKGRRICQKNGLSLGKLSEFIGNFRAVLFTPEHLSLVKEGPALRRSFLDAALCQLSPSYVSHLQFYTRILKQRNKLLSDIADGLISKRQGGDLLEGWTRQLCLEGEKIERARISYTGRLQELVGEIFEDMTGGQEKISIRYLSVRGEESYEQFFKRLLPKEMIIGSSLGGIQKDDLEILLNGKAVRLFGSQGQQRSAALAMKLAEGEISKEKTGEYPVFLLDDILSELDTRRKNYILSGIQGKQVLITTCEKDLFVEGNRIFCQAGKYSISSIPTN